MMCGHVQCPWHGSQFNVNTGAVIAGSASKKIVTYPLQEQKEGVYILL
ncbi:MAG: Rieske (2Fe-2S) protein [Cytophagaceae bacterium]